MNNKITFPRLATMLADKSGRSKRFSEDFLREFFSIISERLESGESVKIKGLGTFKLSRVEPRKSVDVTTGQPMEISGHSKVAFIPAKELAEAVNAPFEAFTAIEIDDNTDIQQLLSKDDLIVDSIEDEYDECKDDIEKPDSESIAEEAFSIEINKSHQQTLYADESERHETNEDHTGNEDAGNTEMSVGGSREDLNNDDNTERVDDAESSSRVEQEENTAVNEEAEASDMEDTDDEFEDYDEPVISRKKNWIKGVLISFAAAIIALIATFAVWYVFATNDFNRRFNKETPSMAKGPVEGFTVGKALEIPSDETSDDQSSVAETKSPGEDKADEEETTKEIEEPAKDVEEVPTAPSDAVVYDTISTTRYLTTMAKKHYGNFNLWPYIYEENKAKLGHPDRIRPGTPVVIPKLSKYGVDPKNAADIEKAKKMGIAIYAKYGKSI